MYRKYIAIKYNLFFHNYIVVNFLHYYLKRTIIIPILRYAKDKSLEKQYAQSD